MTTPPRDDRRLRAVPEEPTLHEPDLDVPSAHAQVADFVALVAQRRVGATLAALDKMSVQQLRGLAMDLARQVHTTEIMLGEGPDVSPEGICAGASIIAAQLFKTTQDAILSADRHRDVTDARAVAMTAARRSGLTLPAIARYFGKDHTTVMYAGGKVENNLRLEVACRRIVAQLAERYTHQDAHARHASPPTVGRSSTLQLSALTDLRGADSPNHPERNTFGRDMNSPDGPTR